MSAKPNRIYCRTPSTGYPENLYLIDVPDTVFTTVGPIGPYTGLGANAPDYSIPDPSRQYETRDPLDDARAIIPGQIFFLTPLSVTNKSVTEAYLDCQILAQDGTIINVGRAVVPAGDTAYIPLQGRSLLKRNPIPDDGDQLQVMASDPNAFDVIISADLSPASQNLGVYVPL